MVRQIQAGVGVMNIAAIAAQARINHDRLHPWDLSKVGAYLVEREGMNPVNVEAIMAEYKRFLAITLAMPPGENFPISAVVDPIWHTHLMFTHDYTSMCHAVADGIYIHHVPATTDEERGRLCSAYRENTLPIYREAFGEPDQQFWPSDAQICVACCDRPVPGIDDNVRRLII